MGLKIYNIEKSEFETEKVCAEGVMKFLYGTGAGNFALWSLVARPIFSRLCGLWADSKFSAKSVGNFIASNSIDAEEFERDASTFKSFNEFFYRTLKPSARPVEKSDNAPILFPSDGRHLLVRNASESDIFYIKGQRFNIAKFLGDEKLAARFIGGDMLISRLSPVDYHRFHSPIDGEIAARKGIEGKLFSVSPIALIPRISIFWENKRVLNIVDSPDFGMCAFVEIGATNVGTIVNLKKVGERISAGECAGYFKLGASCVVTLFPKGVKINWNGELLRMAEKGVECFARVNTLAGTISTD